MTAEIQKGARKSNQKRLLLGGYFSSLKDKSAKKRYTDKLRFINGIDPYETERKDWKDDVELWPAVTHVNLGMYLLVTPCPYSGEDLLNYKSLDCYRNVLSGWEVLVKSLTDDEGMEKKVLIAKVCRTS